MAVAAADFYTYARATGTPLPKSKQEEAQLAPAVDKWKKSRLSNRNASEENNLSDTTWYTPGEAAGLTAALAGIGAGVVAARNPATRQRISQILRPNVPVNEPEAVAKVVEQVTPQAGTGVSTNVGGLTQDLNVDLSSTPATPIAKTWVEQKLKQTPQRAVVVEKVAPQPEVATVIPKATPEFETEFINTAARERDFNLAYARARQEGLADADAVIRARQVIGQKIPEGYTPGPESEIRQQLSQLELSSPVEFSPRSYVESTGAIEPAVVVEKVAPQPATLVDVGKTDDLVVSQQSIENSNLNLNANANAGVQLGLDPEVSKVASSPINQNTVNTATDKAQAAALIAVRRTQLEQAGLTPGTTEFDNALVKGWSARSDVEPSVTSEKFRENVVLPKEVEEVISTKIPESDATNVAKNYYDPNTGNIELATEEGGSPLIRDIYKERVVPSEDVSKAASGTNIRGTSRSLDIAGPKERFRIDELTDVKSPDTIGGFVGPSSVEITERATGSALQYKGPRPAGTQYYNEASPALPLNERAPRTPVRPLIQSETPRIDSYANQGGGAGMGVYGRQLGYVPGPTSATAGTKPTQLPQGRYGEFNPTTSRDEFRNYSNEALQKRIDTGTYRSGKVSEGAREAQKELNLRKNLKYPVNYKPSKETTINAMKVSDDIRRIYNSGRPDAQQLVNEYKANLRNNLGI